MFSAAVACTAMIDGALSDWLRIGKVDPPCWCPVFPYGVAAVAAGEPVHSNPRGIKFLHLNLPKKHRIYWLSKGRFREGYSVHPAESPPRRRAPPMRLFPRPGIRHAARALCVVIRLQVPGADRSGGLGCEKLAGEPMKRRSKSRRQRPRRQSMSGRSARAHTRSERGRNRGTESLGDLPRPDRLGLVMK